MNELKVLTIEEKNSPEWFQFADLRKARRSSFDVDPNADDLDHLLEKYPQRVAIEIYSHAMRYREISNCFMRLTVYSVRKSLEFLDQYFKAN